MLQLAKFQRLDSNFNTAAEIGVQFNPTELVLNKSVQITDIDIPGLDMPILQFVRGQAETLNVDLFFDSTDESGIGESAAPVTKKTDQFYQLIKIDPRSHAPPICRFVWGPATFPGSNFTGRWASQNRENGFQCVVEGVRQQFTMFSPKGVPLRAKLTVTLKEYQSLDQQIDSIRFESPDLTHAHVVKEGETLSQVAARIYDDPRQWRAIARHNRIDDPLALVPGMVLEVPPIR
jgi:nucleoid-associated protein YgaU